MKHLKEYIARTINEVAGSEDIIAHNVKQLDTIKFDGKSLFERFWPGDWIPAEYLSGRDIWGGQKVKPGTDQQGPSAFEEENKIKLVASIKSLTTSKIVKGAGRGAYKYVYILDNTHALSIFKGGYNIEDIDIFKKMYDSQFGGTGSKNDPAIYDISTVQDTQGGEISFVEMSQVIPIRAWLSMSGRESGTHGEKGASRTIQAIKKMVSSIKHISSFTDGDEYKLRPSASTIIKLIKAKRLSYKDPWQHNDDPRIMIEMPKIEGLTKKEAWGFLRMLLHVAHTHGWASLGDMHMGNFGVMIQNPTTFIAYDI